MSGSEPVKLPLAVTMGEPAGIGGEIALKAWLNRGDGVPPFYLIDDPDRLASLARRLGWPTPIRSIDAPDQALAVFNDAVPVTPIGMAIHARPARPDPGDAPAVLHSIEAAVRDVRSGRAAALVTNPIHKDSLYRAGFHHPGHTEYLAELAGAGAAPIMMLACPALRGDFGVGSPVLSVAGLNPHAGETGSLGREEIEIIEPAVAELRAAGIDARGPLPPDTMFHAEARSAYDAALCMYHDQALIPIKTIDFHGGVNVTLGLPFVRTSPDHGTALAIAGRGTARPDSLIAALRLAAEMAARRSAAS